MKKHVLILFLITVSSIFAQQNVTIDVYPTISKSIKGHKELQRDKYFNLAANVNEIKKVISDDTQFDYYFRDLGITVGRKLGVVNGPVKWGNSVKEDSSRPGYADIDYLKNNTNPSDDGLDDLKAIFGESQGLAAHENHNAYPDFMPKYTATGSDDEFPSNNLAAAELSSNILKYDYTDFQRPSYYELVNEPDWRFWSDQRFYDFHLECKKAVDKMGLNTKVGGPCFSVSSFYKDQFQKMSSMTHFIDGTNFDLDFYSFHTYDYMHWDGRDFVGSITSGLPLESVFEALAAYTYTNYGQEFKYVGSEHGAYLSDADNRNAAHDYIEDTYFPNSSGFDHEMTLRSVDNYIMVNGAITNTMVFMNHPYIVEKTVPFILLETSSWDPYYYSSLLVKQDFDKNNPDWVESRLIDYYRFFKDVKGRRVHTVCEDPDILYHSFVDGNRLICVMKNQSDTGGKLSLNLKNSGRSVKSYKLRRLKRNADFTPSFTEEKLSALSDIPFAMQEAMVLFVEFDADVAEERTYNEDMYYCKDVATVVDDSKTFLVKVPDYDELVYATLRIALSRDAADSKTVNVTFNGQTLEVPLEDCADRITSDDYATTKIIKIPMELLQKYNQVTVSFPDHKTGGVGAVIISGSKEVVSSALNVIDGNKNIEIYPNPTANKITIKHQGEGLFEMYDLNGDLVKSQLSGRQTTQISMADMPSGIYLLRLLADDYNSELQKVVVL